MFNAIALDDKTSWCKHGEREEDAFVECAFIRWGLKVSINPEKKIDKYATDLIINGRLVDLKSVREPFFKAQSLYGFDPDYTVTINCKDIERYREKQMSVAFWVDWPAQQAFGVKIHRHNALYGVSIQNLVRILGPAHIYPERGGSNAKASYLIDVRMMTRYPDANVREER